MSLLQLQTTLNRVTYAVRTGVCKAQCHVHALDGVHSRAYRTPCIGRNTPHSVRGHEARPRKALAQARIPCFGRAPLEGPAHPHYCLPRLSGGAAVHSQVSGYAGGLALSCHNHQLELGRNALRGHRHRIASVCCLRTPVEWRWVLISPLGTAMPIQSQSEAGRAPVWQ